MVTSLAGYAVVIEEQDNGPVAEAFEISEFPAILLIRDRVIRQAEHGLAGILAAVTPSSVSADPQPRS